MSYLATYVRPRLPFVSVLVLSAFALGEPNAAKGEATHLGVGLHKNYGSYGDVLGYKWCIHSVCVYDQIDVDVDVDVDVDGEIEIERER